MEGSNEDNYQASSEQVASLKTDLSILTPEQDEYVSSLADLINNAFIGKFHPFLRSEALNKNKEIRKRVIITDLDSFRQFDEEWDHGKPDSNTVASYYGKGGLIIVTDVNTVWDHLQNEDRKLLIQAYGSEEDAEAMTREWDLSHNLAHEIAHAYQAEGLPTFFKESGARYYGGQILDLLGVPYRYEEPHMIDFYSQQIAKYGDNVHKKFFGQIIP